MAVNICDNCGTAAADEQFCPNCGAWIDQLKPARSEGEDFEEFSLEEAPPEGEDVAAPVRFPRSEIPCPSCGSSNPATNRHCEECGARLSQGALPVAPRPAVQSTAGVRAALAIGGVLILVVLISLLFNLFGGDDPTTTSSVVAADTTTTTAPVAGPIAILRAECSVEGLSGFDCRNLIDSGDGEYQFNWERLESDQEVRIRLIFAEPMVVHKVKPKAEAHGHVLELLSKVGLRPEHYDRYPHEFSGGQRQRICIARALGLSPKMIIADEAVSALDVTIQAQVINLFMDLQAEFGLSLLFISHDMAVVERISHRVAVMYLGRIVEMGPRRAVFDNPQHSYTRKLLSAVPIADPTAERSKRALMVDEIPSAVRSLDYRPEPLTFREAGPGHLVANE